MIWHFAFLLSVKADDFHGEVNFIVVLDSKGEDFAFALTAMVNLEKILNKQNRAEKLPLRQFHDYLAW